MFSFHIGPPDLLNGFNATLHNTSDTLTLYCVYTSYPMARIYWYHHSITSTIATNISDDSIRIAITNGKELIERSSTDGSGSDDDSLMPLDPTKLAHQLIERFRLIFTVISCLSAGD